MVSDKQTDVNDESRFLVLRSRPSILRTSRWSRCGSCKEHHRNDHPLIWHFLYNSTGAPPMMNISDSGRILDFPWKKFLQRILFLWKILFASMILRQYRDQDQDQDRDRDRDRDRGQDQDQVGTTGATHSECDTLLNMYGLRMCVHAILHSLLVELQY